MRGFMNSATSRTGWLCLLFFSVSMTGCGGNAETDSSNSPEATFKAFQADFKSQDYEKAVGHLTEESQKAMAGALTFGGGFAALFSPNGSELKAIMKEHGLDMENQGANETINLDDPESTRRALRAVGDKIKDRPKYIAAVVKWFEKQDSENKNSRASDIAAATLTDLKVEGERATAAITVAGKAEPIEFRKIGGKWQIHLTESMLGGQSTTVAGPSGRDSDSGFSFDQTGGNFRFGDDFEESDELPPSEPISLQDYETAWKVVAPVQGKTAGEVIAEMAKQCGLELTAIDDFAELLAMPVTIESVGQSRLQVIETAATQTGLYPVYELRTLTLKKGTRSLPVQFSGPFLIEVHSVDTNAPYPTGTLRLRCAAAGLPTSVVARIKELSDFGSDKRFEIKTTAVVSGATDLRQSEQSSGFVNNATFSKSNARLNSSSELMSLLRSVESIDSIKGTIDFSLVAEISTVKFSKAGESKTSGDRKLTLKDWSSQVAVTFEGYEPDKMTIVGRDKDGNRMIGQGASSSSLGEKGEKSKGFESRPESIEVELVEKIELLSYPFEFSKIAVPNFENMPEKMVELAFTGSEPLKFQFDKIVTKDFAGQKQDHAIFKLTNATNKPISGFHGSLNYLDATGKKLDDFPNSNNAPPDFFPGPGETKEIEVHMPFAPEGTKQVSIELGGVSFPDGTKWEAGKK